MPSGPEGRRLLFLEMGGKGTALAGDPGPAWQGPVRGAPESRDSRPDGIFSRPRRHAVKVKAGSKMKCLSAILALLLLATAQPFGVVAGILCEVKGEACQANGVLGVQCCCDTGCDCDGSKDRTTAPSRAVSPDNLRLDFALVEMPMQAPAASEAQVFTPCRIAIELMIAHALPRVAVTCIRLN